MKKIFFIAVAALLFAGCSNSGGTGGDSDSKPVVTPGGDGTTVLGVVMSPTTLSLILPDPVRKTGKISATVAPTTADQTVTWSSANNNIATVDNTGQVTATGAGIVVITATSAGLTLAGTPGIGTCTVTVSATDPALFRWYAEEDEEFEDIDLNTYRTYKEVPMLAMGQKIIASQSKSGKKGYLLNKEGDGERDPDTGAHLSAGVQAIRDANARLLIGLTDYGTCDTSVTPPAYSELSSNVYAPAGTLDLYQKLKITVEFSDMTSGVSDAAGGWLPMPNQYGWQIFALNNTTGMNNSPLSGSRILSDNPSSPPAGGDGEVTVRFNGTTKVPAGNVEQEDLIAYLQKGFISIHSGYGRQLVVRSIVIEPDTD